MKLLSLFLFIVSLVIVLFFLSTTLDGKLGSYSALSYITGKMLKVGFTGKQAGGETGTGRKERSF